MISEHAALTELVALNDLWSKIESLSNQEYKKAEVRQLTIEYLNRKPLAWENARLALRLSQVDWTMNGERHATST